MSGGRLLPSHQDDAGLDDAAGNLGVGEMACLGALELGPGDAVPPRDSVEPFLSALLQVEHLNLLVGSGLTTALAKLVDHDASSVMQVRLPFDGEELASVACALENAAKASAEQAGRGEPNIEDRLRVAIAAADGLGVVGDCRAKGIRQAIDDALSELREQICGIEAELLTSQVAPERESVSARNLLRYFLGAFASRPATHDRLHMFTTNYDRVIEWGAELAGLRIIDRFVGTLEPVFRSSRLEVDYHYTPPGSVRDPRYLDGVIRLTKLHGSLDWRIDGTARRVVRAALPFGESQGGGVDELLIYPQASKDVETIYYPYGDLFRDFSAALCRPHSALVTYGYGFGDDHINRIIKDMLTIPSTYLLVISFGDESERIRNFISDNQRLGQIGYLIGSSLADLEVLVEKFLPRPSGESLARTEAQIRRERNRNSSASAILDDQRETDE